MNIERTREYYRHLTNDDLCQCDYCKNYVKEIKAAYPEVAKYLDSIGIDIEKPFETMPIEIEDMIEYTAVQYIVMGNREGFQQHRIGDVEIDIANNHPFSNISDEHFILEIFPVFLKCMI